MAVAALTKKKKKSVKVLSPGKRRWLNAVKLIKDRGDPSKVQSGQNKNPKGQET